MASEPTSTISIEELSPEVRGYIARLQERIRDLQDTLRAQRAFHSAAIESLDRVAARTEFTPPAGIHELSSPRRVDHDAVEDGEQWWEWRIECSCGWEEGGYERDTHAEMIGRMHAGYYDSADFD